TAKGCRWETPSNHFVRCKFAGRFPAGFDLNGHVTNLEPMLQLASRFHQECIPGMPRWNDGVARQRDLGGAHRPDMEVMNLVDARSSLQEFPDGGGFDIRRHP